MHVSRCAVCTLHITRTAIPKSMRTECPKRKYKDTSGNIKVLKNIQHCTPIFKKPIIQEKRKEIKKEPKAMCSTGATRIFKCELQNQINFLLVK